MKHTESRADRNQNHKSQGDSQQVKKLQMPEFIRAGPRQARGEETLADGSGDISLSQKELLPFFHTEF